MSIAAKIFRAGVELSFRANIMPSFFSNEIQHFILVYHGVAPEGSKKFNTRHESVFCFEKQIQFLSNHFHIIKLEDFFEEKFLPGKINAAITFDDGYRNNFLYAKPILEEYAAPATIFVTGMNEIKSEMLWADFLNIVSYYYSDPVEIGGEVFKNDGNNYVSESTGRSLYDVIKNDRTDYGFKEEMYQAFNPARKFFLESSNHDYWQLMSDKEIVECSRSDYIDIGSHSYFHNNLGATSKSGATEELRKSKLYLENLLQCSVHSLAYPDGSYSRDIISIAYEIGFREQVAAGGFLYDEDRNDNRIRDRIGIYNCGRCGNQLLSAIKNHFA